MACPRPSVRELLHGISEPLSTLIPGREGKGLSPLPGLQKARAKGLGVCSEETSRGCRDGKVVVMTWERLYKTGITDLKILESFQGYPS